MRLRALVCALFAFAVVAVPQTGGALTAVDLGGTTATEATPVPLKAPSPAWYTPELHERVLAAGPSGLEVPLSNHDIEASIHCNGLGGLSAGGCMVSPNVCTMNFVFAKSGDRYIGTAGHCAETVGQDVVMQSGPRIDVGTMSLTKVGSVVQTTGDGGVGNDFALVKIDAGIGVDPAIPIVGGPTGALCDFGFGEPLLHYGHGYHVTAQQGYPRAGAVVFTDGEEYGWAGFALGGDSGSPVVSALDGQALGNLTHGIGVSVVPLPGLAFGTTIDRIFELIGPGFSVLHADGTTSFC